MAVFDVVGATSTLIIEARSSMGPISFETTGLSGSVEATVRDGAIDARQPIAAHLAVPLQTLRSGSEMFDAELARRIESRIHPVAELHLVAGEPTAGTSRWQLTGEMSFHATTRPLSGTVQLEQVSDDRLVVVGEKVIDIRDYRLAAPTMLMLKIYPDVRVILLVEAVRSRTAASGEGG